MKKPPQPAANLFENEELFTGTYGPAPVPVPKPVLVPEPPPIGEPPPPKKSLSVASGSRQRPPERVGYRTVLRQITDAVLGELNARGEQWPADARQDLISTLFIAAQKEKRIAFDFEPEEPKK